MSDRPETLADYIQQVADLARDLEESNGTKITLGSIPGFMNGLYLNLSENQANVLVELADLVHKEHDLH